MLLDDRVVVVTGAAGGIGAALCSSFAAAGARLVAAVDINAASLGAVVGALQAAGTEAVGIAADVANEAHVRGFVRQIEAVHGRIDVLVQNAGYFAFGGPEAPDSAWQRCLAVNVMAHVYGARAVLTGMLARRDGYIVNMCSAAGILADPTAAPYSVSKHAAVAFAEWLAIACRGTGVCVSAVCPQGVATPMLDTFLASAGEAAESFVGEVLSPVTVANRVLAGMAAEDFLIYPHSVTASAEMERARNHEGWIAAQPYLFDVAKAMGSGGGGS